jgi:pimeloyl-ACP methyl ester carboxylesterase
MSDPIQSNMPPLSRPLIIFSHGNSFPSSTYRVMTANLEKRGYAVKAIEKLGHDPAYPVTSNWPHLVQQLADFTSQQVKKTGQAAYLVGHSLGGFLSLMCAARHPELGGRALGGVVLLDAPVIGGWRAAGLGLAKRARLVGSVAPAAISRKRKQHWPSQDDALAHFSGKKMFSLWHEQCLRDYVAHGTQDVEGQRMLSFDRDVETAIYNTLPDNLELLLKQHPLKCPVTFIGGNQSREIRRVGMAPTEKVTQGRIMMLDGTHLFPMENPLASAAAVETALLNMHARDALPRLPR